MPKKLAEVSKVKKPGCCSFSWNLRSGTVRQDDKQMIAQRQPSYNAEYLTVKVL